MYLLTRCSGIAVLLGLRRSSLSRLDVCDVGRGSELEVFVQSFEAYMNSLDEGFSSPWALRVRARDARRRRAAPARPRGEY